MTHLQPRSIFARLAVSNQNMVRDDGTISHTIVYLPDPTFASVQVTGTHCSGTTGATSGLPSQAVWDRLATV